MIEWGLDEQREAWIGVVGGLPILEVTEHDSIMFGFTVKEFDDGEMGCANDFEKEKTYLENHYNEWLKKSGYIKDPDKPEAMETGKEQQSCGTCNFWEQISKLNRDPIGKCTWRPANVPSWYVGGGGMIFQSGGKYCPAYDEKVTP